jgi:hypothetical protein
MTKVGPDQWSKFVVLGVFSFDVIMLAFAIRLFSLCWRPYTERRAGDD